MDIESIILILASVFSSTGLWSFIIYKLDRKTAGRSLLLAVTAQTIIQLAHKYNHAGHISIEEYRSIKELYEIYKKIGGNGLVTRVMNELERLPFGPSSGEIK